MDSKGKDSIKLADDDLSPKFQVVEGAISTIRFNSLFNLLNDLLKEKHLLLQGCNVVKKKQGRREFYIINFKKTSQLDVFSYLGHQYKASHLTIDKWFADKDEHARFL